MASRDGFAAAADEVEAALGPVSLLFNNAGVNLFQPIDESSYDDWDWVLGVNLHGVINGMMTFVPRSRTRRGGHVVNTASMASCRPVAGPGGHLQLLEVRRRGLSESLRYSLAPHGIGVSVLCPGLVKSYIYASDEIRPTRSRPTPRPTDPAFVERLAHVHEAGMVASRGRRQGARRDSRQSLLRVHPSGAQGRAAEVFDEIIADYPTGEHPLTGPPSNGAAGAPSQAREASRRAT